MQSWPLDTDLCDSRTRPPKTRCVHGRHPLLPKLPAAIVEDQGGPLRITKPAKPSADARLAWSESMMPVFPNERAKSTFGDFSLNVPLRDLAEYSSPSPRGNRTAGVRQPMVGHRALRTYPNGYPDLNVGNAGNDPSGSHIQRPWD